MQTTTPLYSALCAALLLSTSPALLAQAFEARGESELSIKANKDQLTARGVARKAAERDAVKSALRLKLNLDTSSPKVEAALTDLTKNLADNLRTTFTTEGDLLTARSVLTVDSAALTDMARSMGLQSQTAMEAASILFLVDEYWGVATTLDPSKPLVTESEYFHDKGSSSDTSAKASGSAYSDTSAKGSSSASYNGNLAASSKQSASVAASDRQSVAGSSSSSVAASGKASLSAADGSGGAVAANRSASYFGSQKESFAGSSSSDLNASRNSDVRVAASEQSASAKSSDVKNVKSGSFSSDQTNVQIQKDTVSIKTRTVFPDVSNAKPSDAQSSLISQRLAQVTGQYGLQYTPERDLRETGKGRMLIADIEAQRRFDEYTSRAGKNPYNAKYVVFGSAVMSGEGKSASGQSLCSGLLKLDSFNVDTGRGLAGGAGTINKRAQGSSDQDCRSNLSTALATELAQTLGNAATRERQLAATQGQAYTVTLFSSMAITRRIGGSFEDGLKGVVGAEALKEDKRTESTRIYTVSAKGGDLGRRVEKLLDDMGETMKSAEVQSRGNRIVVCIEGKCPVEY